MPFFPDYPKIPYKFGSENFNVEFSDLVRYSEILDVIKENGSFYQKYYIRNGQRSDNLSWELYKTPNFHWTFFYLNDNLREGGWPLDQYQIEKKIEIDFPNTVIITTDEMFSTFDVGATVTGSLSGETGIILKKNVDLGQLTIEGNLSFTAGEILTNNQDDGTLTVVSSSPEKESPLYYSKAGERSDIDPFLGPDSDELPVTNEDFYLTENEKLRDIIVMKPSTVNQFFLEFRDAMRD